MPKWSKDAKEFSVSITYNAEKGSQVRVPKPILEKMGNPSRLRFIVGRTGRIEIEPEDITSSPQVPVRKKS